MSDQSTDVKAILYTDGGFHAQYGSGGWGVHGYTFIEKEPTKGTGNPKAIPTSKGYATEKGVGKPVTIDKYIDGVGGVHQANSSNQTELTATIQALNWIVDKGVKHSTIFTDSRYVTNGLNDWIAKWKARDWKNGQGEEVSNKQLWMTADDLVNRAKNAEQIIKFEWIKGHNGFFGNEMADSYASKGNVLGRKKDHFTFMLERDAAGYWSKKYEYNRMLTGNEWLFSTIDDAYTTPCGKTVYYISDIADEDLRGKRDPDNALSVVYLNTAEPVLEKLRTKAIELDRRKRGSLIVGRLDSIFSPSVYAELVEHGTVFMDWDTKRLDIVHSSRRPVLKEKSPAGLAYVAVDNFNALQRKLDAYRAGEKEIIVTDITDHFYDKSEKKGQVVRTLKKDFSQSTKHFDLMTRYSTARVSDLSGPDDPSIVLKKIRFLVTIDLPKRNMLASLADSIIRVVAITWRESDQAFRYATVVETEIGLGIWAGVDSNVLIV